MEAGQGFRDLGSQAVLRAGPGFRSPGWLGSELEAKDGKAGTPYSGENPRMELVGLVF